MANIVKHKRGSGNDPSASDLVLGELAIRTDNGKLFTKMDSGAIAEIAGGGSDIAINTLSSSSATGGGSATFNGSAYRFTLSSPPSVSAQQLLVSIAGVIQKPVAGSGQPSEGFSISGNDIILAQAPASGTDFFILTFRSLGVSEPADNTVTSAKIVDGTIVNADINASAAIAGSKISPDFGSQNITTSGTITTTGNALTIQGTHPDLIFTDTNNNDDFKIHLESGTLRIKSDTDNLDRFAINSNGLVGINTTTPEEQLHIRNSANCLLLLEDTQGANQVAVRYKTTTGQWIAGVHGGDGNKWKVTNSNTFGGGNDYLSIGTNASVNIAGFFNMTCVNPSIYFYDSASNPDYRLYNNGGSFRLKDTTNAVERLIVNSTGQISTGGITNPTGVFCINTGAGTTQGNTLELRRSGSNDYHGLSLFTGTTVDWSVGQNSLNAFEVYENGSASTTRLTILNGGNTGIGTRSPSQKLHVSGSAPEILLEHTGGYDMTLTTSDGMGMNGITVNGGFLSLAYNNKNVVMCRTGGNVGIGGTAPNYQLHCTTGIGIGGHGLNNQQLSITNNSIQTLNLGVGYTNLSLNALGGLVGIGTTAPVEKLGINGDIRLVNPTGTTRRISALPSGGYNVGVSGGSAVAFHRIADSGGGSDEIAFETHWQGNRHGESARISKFGGITFNGDTAAANALDDYEEGTWTPTLPSGASASSLSGQYTKIGNKVFWAFQLTGLSGSAGFTISGLPYTVANGWGGNISIANDNHSPEHIYVFAHNNQSIIYFRNDSNVTYNTSTFAGHFFYCNGFYQV